MVTAMSFYRFSIGFLMICFGLGELLFARSIVDMSGQTLEVPETITKLYASSPPSTYMLYTIDPSLIVGLNFDHAKGNNESSRPKVRTVWRANATALRITKRSKSPAVSIPICVSQAAVKEWKK